MAILSIYAFKDLVFIHLCILISVFKKGIREDK